MSYVGRKLREARERAGLTQEQLIERLAQRGISCTRNTIGNWERGVGAPDAKELPALAQSLAVDILFFFDRRRIPTVGDKTPQRAAAAKSGG